LAARTQEKLDVRVAVVDAGPLFAATNAADPDHAACTEVLRRSDIRLVIPALILTEATYLVERRLGPAVEARFLASFADLDVRAPEPEDWKDIAALVHRFRDLPLGGADASLIVLANRLRTRLIVTLDQRHFRVVKNAAGQPFELLPEL
jgi:predicted nucleic acid-binding protein